MRSSRARGCLQCPPWVLACSVRRPPGPVAGRCPARDDTVYSLKCDNLYHNDRAVLAHRRVSRARATIRLCIAMSTTVSREVLLAARRLAERNALADASMADIAEEAGLTRVTLYRRGDTRAAILTALRDELVREERDLLLPILAADGDARARMILALEALCATTEARMHLRREHGWSAERTTSAVIDMAMRGLDR